MAKRSRRKKSLPPPGFVPKGPSIEVVSQSRSVEGLNVHVVDFIHRPGASKKFQVFDVTTGQIIVEARNRRGAEQKLLNYMLGSKYRVMQYGRWVSPAPSIKTMKIKVRRVDGRTEVLTLQEPLSFRNGPDDSMLRSGFVDHFFCEDGRYNGWGSNQSSRGAKDIEKNRVIED
jgi:hypothetical protein